MWQIALRQSRMRLRSENQDLFSVVMIVDMPLFLMKDSNHVALIETSSNMPRAMSQAFTSLFSRYATGWIGLPAKARCRTVSMPWPCLRSVSRQERMTQKCSAPASVRKQPEIFCFTLGMRTARSPTLLVNGTAGLLMKSRTASACKRKRRSRLAATDCLPRPCCPGCCSVSGWIASPSRTRAS
ncbi:hypothetical protein D3C81_507140 [compost metagenome]